MSLSEGFFPSPELLPLLGMNIRWDYFVNQYDTARYVSNADGRDNRHIQFVQEFASVVSVLQACFFSTVRLGNRLTQGFCFFFFINAQDKTNNVIDMHKDINRAVEDLSTCSYTTEAFSDLITKVQSAV